MRRDLEDFWTEVGRQMPWHNTTRGEGDATSLSPATRLVANWVGHFSPSQRNPFALNPLRDMLGRGETRLLAHGPFLELLKEYGQQRARQWVNVHAGDVGATSSIDLVQLFG